MKEDEIASRIAAYHTDFPVAVGRLAEELKLAVVSTADLPKGMSGSIAKEDEGYVIYVNAGHPLRRQRFTIAHEIGHYLKDRTYLDQADEILNPSKKFALPHLEDAAMHLPGVEDRQREFEADEFARNLLMPEVPFKEVWVKAQCLKDVADYFGISEMAANMRAALLGLGYFDELNGSAV